MELKKEQIERLLKEAIKDAKESTTTRFGNGVRYVSYGDYAVCVGWQPGYGDEKLDDCIQYEENLDWALNVGVKVYNPYDMCEYEELTAPMQGSDDIVRNDLTIDPRWDDKTIEEIASQLAKETGRLERI